MNTFSHSYTRGKSCQCTRHVFLRLFSRACDEQPKEWVDAAQLGDRILIGLVVNGK